MKNTYQIIEGMGDPTQPDTLENVQFLDITFTNERIAIEFVWARYWQSIDKLNEWKSYWSNVTTCTTIENALNEITNQMKERTK